MASINLRRPLQNPSFLLKDCLSATQLRERIREPLSFVPKRVLRASLLENDKGLGWFQSHSIQGVLKRFLPFPTRRQKCLSARHTKPPLICVKTRCIAFKLFSRMFSHPGLKSFNTARFDRILNFVLTEHVGNLRPSPFV